ncbi:hypothetical protein JW711_02100 [Candidatus Woesearchaeota archaeon]|nr:hypothetical protein [Candidatus Woesearchaeota archaeon]
MPKLVSICIVFLVFFLSGCAEQGRDLLEEDLVGQSLNGSGEDLTPSILPETSVMEIVKGPTGPLAKYKGLWLPFLREVKIAAENIESLKEDGINVVAIGVKVVATDEEHEWAVSEIREQENESEILESINTFHKNGIKTIIILNPAHGEYGVSPHPSEGTGKGLLEMHDSIVMKWAKISEAYGVDTFCPMNEPSLLAGTEDLSAWAQEILPKIRSVYQGKTAFRVQNLGEDYPLYDLAGYDYVLPMATLCTSDVEHPDENHYKHMKSKNLESLGKIKAAYPGHEIIFFEVGGYTGPDFYWWEPIVPENQAKSQHDWPDDFFMVSPEGQARCFETFFEVGWEESEGYLINVAKGFEFQGKPAEAVIKARFNG